MSDENIHRDSDIDVPLEDDLEALLDRERARRPESDELRDRVYRRVMLGVAEGGGGSGPSNDAPAKKKFPARAAGAIGAILGGIVVLGWPSWQSAHKPDVISIPGDRGSSSAANITNDIPIEPPPANITNDIPIEPPPATVTIDELPAAPATAPAASPETPRSPSRATATAECALCEEQKLLIEARTALGRGDFERALGPLRAHQARYPRGELVQEREALRVRTLAAAGRAEEARAALLAFERAFPSSPFLPSLRGVISQ